MWRVGKKELGQIVEVLEADHETVEDAAAAVLSAAEKVFETRVQWAVVAQLKGTSERPSIPPHDPEAIKLALGWYSTEGDARAACESLCYSSSTGDSFNVWALPVHHGSPADLHAARKAKYVEQETARKDKSRQKVRDQIAKAQAEAKERAAGGKGSCVCSHQQYDHSLVGQGRGKCFECECPKFNEQKARKAA